MATYTCKLFLNTGFNAINIPDSPALVNGMSSVDVPTLDINQERFLPSVRVRAAWDTIKNADYCKVGDFYYIISNIAMTSGDVAEISLVPDYITSAGGTAALTILDGLTNRVHVADDTFGIYSADDPLMAPAYDMDIDSYQLAFSASETTFVETTLSLDTMGVAYANGTLEAYNAYVDQSDPEAGNVVVPVPNYLRASTAYETQLASGTVQTLKNVKCQGLFVVTDGSTGSGKQVGDGINVARALGVENAVSGQFSIPNTLITATTPVGAFVTKLTGITHDYSITGLPYIYGSANNNRIWYGSFSPYTLVSASGNCLSANAEAIYGGGSVPSVRAVVDPRRTGKPYFRFMPLNGNSGTYDFFRGAVAGRQWDNVPLVLQEKSGGLLDRADYAASIARRDITEGWEATTYGWNKAFNMAGIAARTAEGYQKSGIGGALVAGIGSLGGAGNFEAGHLSYRDLANLERQTEQARFQIQQNVNVPSVNFPLDPDLMGETLHNGFMVFRTKYKSQDIARIDKILTAFGYKHVKVLETSDFTNRQKFNYVEGSISVGNLPRWWADGISEQVSGGVRVWHIRPTHTAYSSNPVA